MNYQAQFPLQESQKAWRDSQKFKPYYARAKNPSTWRTGAGAPVGHYGPGSMPGYNPKPMRPLTRPWRPRPGRPTYATRPLTRPLDRENRWRPRPGPWRPTPGRPTYDGGLWGGRPPERPGGWYGRPRPKPGMSYEDYFSGGGKPTPPPNPGYVRPGPWQHPGPNPMHSATHDADYKDWKEEYYAANPEKRWEKVDRSNYLSGVRERGDSFKEFQEKRRQEIEDYYASKPQYHGQAPFTEGREMMEEWEGNRPEWMTQEYTDAYSQGARDRWFEGLEPEDPRRKAWETKKRREHDDWLERMQEWYKRPRPHWQRGPSRNVKYRT